MSRYCYIDLDNGARFESKTYGLETQENVKRDYKSERVGANLTQLRISSAPSYSDDLVMPTAKTYEGPNDPDGSIGLREWCDTHTPAPGNKSPAWPKVTDDKTIYALGGK